jgi:hypothetical protein
VGPPADCHTGGDVSSTVHPTTGHSPEPDIVGYRTLVAIVAIAYFTIIALTPRASSETVPWGQLVVLSTLYLALGVWGFAQVQRQRRFVVSVGYLLLEFAVGMRINSLAWGAFERHRTDLATPGNQLRAALADERRERMDCC